MLPTAAAATPANDPSTAPHTAPLITLTAPAADVQDLQARQRLARNYVAGGTERVERRDLLGALPWLVEALALEGGDPARDETHRIRLALHDRPVLRAHVAGVLWPDSPQRRAAGNLRSALWRLARFPFRLLEADDPIYAWRERMLDAFDGLGRKAMAA